MDKKDIKAILMSMRTTENDGMINKLLGKIDMMDDTSLQNAVKQVGDTEEAVRTFFENKIAEKQNTNKEEHTPINEMFSYGVSGDCIHLHLPTDLHQMISQKGISRTIDTVNLYLLDAIDKIKALKDAGYNRFQEKDSIYMISPILRGKEMEFLEGLDFKTKSYKKQELSSDEFIKENPEAMLATNIFGKEKKVGTAKIKFDTISSMEWQKKKQEVVRLFEEKGISLRDDKSEEKLEIFML